MTSQDPAPTTLPFTILDVFTQSAFTGNPLAIVSLPSPTGFSPTQSQLQNLAREFNLSETIFLEHVSAEDTQTFVRRARIFTTTREILFAGHPTIGAATYLLYVVHNSLNAPIQALVPGAGPIPIARVPGKDGYVSALIPHTYHSHKTQCPAHRLLALHATLGPYVAADGTFPVVSIVHGMTFVLVELESLEALAAAGLGNVSANIIADGTVVDQGWEYNAPICVYLYVRDAEAREDGVEVLRTRMLVRGIEDPATGSAASALAGYLVMEEAEQQGDERQWKIVQGVEMRRRSEIGVRVALKEGLVDTIELSGTAVVVAEGRIRAC